MRRTLALLSVAGVAVVVVAPAIGAEAATGLAPGSYELRLPGAGSVVVDVADDGGVSTLVIPAAVELTLTAGGDLVVDDLLRPVRPDADRSSEG